MGIIATKFQAVLNRRLTRGLPYPKTVTIEPVSNLCQLQCPMCPTGAQLQDYDRVLMSLENFEKILDKLPFVKVVDLYKSGEPFLNPDIFAMISLADQRHIKVVINTNFCFEQQEDFFERVVASGLKRLVVSLDGASQEGYARYRVGGDFQLVMSNVRKLLTAKHKLRSHRPEVIWQFLVNRFNEHEIPAARQIAGELNIKLDVRPMDISDNVPDVEFPGTVAERKAYWLGTNPDYLCDRYKAEPNYPLSQGICSQLFMRPVITADGKILPCCESWNRSSIFGDLQAEPFETIWNNDNYVEARSRFLYKDYMSRDHTVCCKCRNFEAAYSLGEKFKLLLTISLAKISWIFKA